MPAVVRLCVGPYLWRFMPADAALSEKSPHLGSAQVRPSLSKNLTMKPEDLRGRDRSPSGPALWRSCSVAIHVCGGPSLRWSVSVAFHARRRGAFGEIAPPRNCSGEAEFAEEP